MSRAFLIQKPIFDILLQFRQQRYYIFAKYTRIYDEKYFFIQNTCIYVLFFVPLQAFTTRNHYSTLFSTVIVAA